MKTLSLIHLLRKKPHNGLKVHTLRNSPETLLQRFSFNKSSSDQAFPLMLGVQ